MRSPANACNRKPRSGRLPLSALVALLVTALLLAGADAQDPVPSITVARISGTVEVWHKDATDGKWQAATKKQVLESGWRLRTGKKSKAQLLFPLDNTVILKENSVLTVDRIDKGGGAKLKAEAGGFLFDLKRALDPGSSFEVETPTALASVRGTSFGVQLEETADEGTATPSGSVVYPGAGVGQPTIMGDNIDLPEHGAKARQPLGEEFQDGDIPTGQDAIEPRNILKTYFETGDIPTEQGKTTPKSDFGDRMKAGLETAGGRSSGGLDDGAPEDDGSTDHAINEKGIPGGSGKDSGKKKTAARAGDLNGDGRPDIVLIDTGAGGAPLSIVLSGCEGSGGGSEPGGSAGLVLDGKNKKITMESREGDIDIMTKPGPGEVEDISQAMGPDYITAKHLSEPKYLEIPVGDVDGDGLDDFALALRSADGQNLLLGKQSFPLKKEEGGRHTPFHNKAAGGLDQDDDGDSILTKDEELDLTRPGRLGTANGGVERPGGDASTAGKGSGPGANTGVNETLPDTKLHSARILGEQLLEDIGAQLEQGAYLSAGQFEALLDSALNLVDDRMAPQVCDIDADGVPDAALADLDGDGLLDFVVLSNGVAIKEKGTGADPNRSAGMGKPVRNWIHTAVGRGEDIGDLDGDGYEDVVLTGMLVREIEYARIKHPDLLNKAAGPGDPDADDDGPSTDGDAVAINQKGTGADKNRTAPGGSEDDDDDAPTPDGEGVAINQKGTGADKNRGSSSKDPDSLVFNVVNPRAARDNHLQGGVDVMEALRAVIESGDFEDTDNFDAALGTALASVDNGMTAGRERGMSTAHSNPLYVDKGLGGENPLHESGKREPGGSDDFEKNTENVSGGLDPDGDDGTPDSAEGVNPGNVQGVKGDWDGELRDDDDDGDGVDDSDTESKKYTPRSGSITSADFDYKAQSRGTKFFGYDGVVSVSNGVGTKGLASGKTISSRPGEAPSEPYDSGPEADEFLLDMLSIYDMSDFGMDRLQDYDLQVLALLERAQNLPESVALDPGTRRDSGITAANEGRDRLLQDVMELAQDETGFLNGNDVFSLKAVQALFDPLYDVLSRAGGGGRGGSIGAPKKSFGQKLGGSAEAGGEEQGDDSGGPEQSARQGSSGRTKYYDDGTEGEAESQAYGAKTGKTGRAKRFEEQPGSDESRAGEKGSYGGMTGIGHPNHGNNENWPFEGGSVLKRFGMGGETQPEMPFDLDGDGTNETLTSLGDIDGDGLDDFVLAFSSGPRQSTSQDGSFAHRAGLPVEPSGVAIKTKGTGADKDRRSGGGGEQEDEEPADGGQIEPSGVAIKTKGTGADKNRSSSSSGGGQAPATILLEADLDGDGEYEPLTGRAIGDLNEDGAMDYCVESSQNGAVIHWQLEVRALRIEMKREAGGGGDEDNPDDEEIDPDSVAIKTRGTGADKNRAAPGGEDPDADDPVDVEVDQIEYKDSLDTHPHKRPGSTREAEGDGADDGDPTDDDTSKKTGLQDKKNRRNINADAKLRMAVGDADGDGAPEQLAIVQCGDLDGDGHPDLYVMPGRERGSDGDLDGITDWKDSDWAIPNGLTDDNGNAPDSEGPAGVEDPNLLGLREYDPSKEYLLGDSVIYNGAIYLAVMRPDEDTDGDGIIDYLDTDSDGDSVPDIDEEGRFANMPHMHKLARMLEADLDGDGVIDALDDDCDGDGYHDLPAGDMDGDGRLDLALALDDLDGDGRRDLVILSGMSHNDEDSDDFNALHKARHDIALNAIRNMKAIAPGGGSGGGGGGAGGTLKESAPKIDLNPKLSTPKGLDVDTQKRSSGTVRDYNWRQVEGPLASMGPFLDEHVRHWEELLAALLEMDAVLSEFEQRDPPVRWSAPESLDELSNMRERLDELEARRSSLGALPGQLLPALEYAVEIGDLDEDCDDLNDDFDEMVAGKMAAMNMQQLTERWDSDPYAEDALAMFCDETTAQAVQDLRAELAAAKHETADLRTQLGARIDALAGEVEDHSEDCDDRDESLRNFSIKLQRLHEEFERFASGDDEPQMLLTYRQMLLHVEGLEGEAQAQQDLFGQTDIPVGSLCAADLENVLKNLGLLLRGGAPPQAPDFPACELFFDRYEEGKSAAQPYLEDVELDGVDDYAATQASIIELWKRIFEFYVRAAEDAGHLFDDGYGLLDQFGGMIGDDNPGLGAHYGTFDSDGDGMSDLIELILGLDPNSPAGDGFIELLSPDNNAEFEFPQDGDELLFEFEPWETELRVDYLLVLESAGGQELTRPADGRRGRAQIDVAGVLSTFAQDLDGSGALGLRWKIVATPDFSDVSGAGNFPQQFASEQRQLVLQTPQQLDQIILDLENEGADSVSPGTQVRVTGVISEVAGLSRWEIRLSYDPSMLRFESGRKLGLFGASTVFFGDQPGGILVISGDAPGGGGGGGLAGEGSVFELVFTALDETGDTTLEGSEIILTGLGGTQLDADFGESVDLEIELQRGSSGGVEGASLAPFDPFGKPGGAR